MRRRSGSSSSRPSRGHPVQERVDGRIIERQTVLLHPERDAPLDGDRGIRRELEVGAGQDRVAAGIRPCHAVISRRARATSSPGSGARTRAPVASGAASMRLTKRSVTCSTSRAARRTTSGGQR